MKAVRIHAFGGPEEVNVESLAVPEPRSNQAIVRVVAAGINPVDWMIREHSYNPKGADRVPITLGQDFSGIIERPARDAESGFQKGDEVFGQVWGSFAEYVAVAEDQLARKPKAVDFVTAAALPMAGLTAWQAMIETAGVSRGQRVLIHGAGGAVGSLAAQLAKWRGARVIATASPPSFAFLRRVGVDHVIDYERERFDDLVSGVNVVLEHLGGDVQRRSFRVMKRGGMLINLIGEIDRAAAKKAQVKGVLFGLEYDVADLERLAGLAEAGIIDPHVSKVLSLDEARAALDLNQKGQSHGKIVLRVA